MNKPKAIKSVIVGDLEQDVIQVFFLNENFEPLEDMPSIPLSLGVYKDKIDDYKFYLSNVVLKPKDINDLQLKTIEDFCKFDYEIYDYYYYTLRDEELNEPTTVQKSMQDGDFWHIVKDICLTDKPFDKEIKEV